MNATISFGAPIYFWSPTYCSGCYYADGKFTNFYNFKTLIINEEHHHYYSLICIKATIFRLRQSCTFLPNYACTRD